jgi:hypothetical protein
MVEKKYESFYHPIKLDSMVEKKYESFYHTIYIYYCNVERYKLNIDESTICIFIHVDIN